MRRAVSEDQSVSSQYENPGGGLGLEPGGSRDFQWVRLLWFDLFVNTKFSFNFLSVLFLLLLFPPVFSFFSQLSVY